MKMQPNIVLVLDEATENHAWIKTGLEQVYGEEIEIRIEVPLKTKEQMIDHIQGIGGHLAALIFDEKLYETGDCDYIGSELAKVYRSYDPKITIYILTSYPDTVDETGDIEYVIDKGYLIEDKLIEKLSPKLRRHVDIYQDMVGERKKRLDELLIKQIDSPLSTGEAQELSKLQYWRTRPIELEESMLSEKLRISLDEKERILAELEDRLGRES